MSDITAPKNKNPFTRRLHSCTAIAVVAMALGAASSPAYAISHDDAVNLLLKTGFQPTASEIANIMAYPTHAAAVNAIVNGDPANKIFTGITTKTTAPLCPWMTSTTNLSGQPDIPSALAYAESNICGPNMEQPSDPSMAAYWTKLLTTKTSGCTSVFAPAGPQAVTNCIISSISSPPFSNIDAWYVLQMIASSSPLTERLNLFWVNHFTSNSIASWPFMNLVKIMRQNAGGNFKTFVSQIMHDPNIINYLSQQSSVYTPPTKVHPNQEPPTANLARELMELFTLGVGTYSETDVLQMARAISGLKFDEGMNAAGTSREFMPYTTSVYPPYVAAHPYNYVSWKNYLHVSTGWFPDGVYDFNPQTQDPGRYQRAIPIKGGDPYDFSNSTPITLLGQTGNFTPDDVVDLLLSYKYNPATCDTTTMATCNQTIAGNVPAQSAQFIVTELWKEFVSDTPNTTEVEQIAFNFQTDWELKPVLTALFNTPEFWNAHGTLVKSPPEFVVGIVRTLGLPLGDLSSYVTQIANDGEPLFSPPNVRGFLTGINWFNTTSLQVRQSTGTLLANLWNAHVNQMVPQVTLATSSTTTKGKTTTVTTATCVPPFSSGYYNTVIVPMELAPGIPPMLSPPAYPTNMVPLTISNVAQQASFEHNCATKWDNYSAAMYATIFSDPAYSLK